VENACLSAVRSESALRVCCDISSISRYRIAVVVDTSRTLRSKNALGTCNLFDKLAEEEGFEPPSELPR
jgi:hypothetical protein